MENTIDITLIWVDPSDEKWQNEYNKYIDSNKKIDSTNCNARFRDWNTLKYVFRGIDKYMPWIRKIHFITFGHIPDWLNIENEKINFLKHEDIFKDKNHLPTFNSAAIEFNFLGIEGLSEKFIAFNDDMLVLKPTSIERFFKEDKCVDFLIQEFPRRGILYKKFFSKDVVADTINNVLNILNKNISKTELSSKFFYDKSYGLKYRCYNYFFNLTTKKYLYFKHFHHPQAYKRETFKKIKDMCPLEIEKTSQSKFRNSDNIMIYIHRYYQLMKGDFYPCYENDYFEKNISSFNDAKQICDAMDSYRFVCVNDSIALQGEEYEKSLSLVQKKLEEVLPQKSQFEK